MLTISSVNRTLQDFWPEWKIVQEIGEGSHGIVYKAVPSSDDCADQNSCAIKVIRVPHNQAEVSAYMAEGNNELTTRAYFLDIVNDFINEINFLDNLKDEEHVVHIFDHNVVTHENEIGWDIYIRMELLTPCLSHFPKEDVDQEEVIRLGRDICQALVSCSKLKLIHRDIKPENIFVTQDGKFKLGDFGVARRLEHKTSSLSQKGTYNYMAPEVFKGNGYAENVDLYSLGIVLYRFMNNNRAPFLSPDKQLITYKETTEAFEKRMSGEEILAPINASPSFAALILKACQFAPEERYRKAEDMLLAFEQLSSSMKAGKRAENAFRRRTNRSTRNKNRNLLYIIVGTVGLLAVVLLAIKTVGQVDERTINLVDYITFNYDGTDGEVYVDANISHDLEDAIAKAMNWDVDVDYDKIDDIYKQVTCVIVSSNNYLSENDKVVAKATFEGKLPKKAKFVFKDGYKTDTVGYYDPDYIIDPFTYMNVQYAGNSPNMKITDESKSSVVDETVDVDYGFFYIFNKEKGIKIGDTIEVTAANVIGNKKDLTLSRTSKSFTCGKNYTYLNKAEDIDAKDLAKMEHNAVNKIDQWFEDSSYGEDIEYTSPSFLGTYLLTGYIPTVLGEHYAFGIENVVYLIFTSKVTAKHGGFKDLTVYIPVELKNVMISDDGSTDYSSDNMDVFVNYRYLSFSRALESMAYNTSQDPLYHPYLPLFESEYSVYKRFVEDRDDDEFSISGKLHMFGDNKNSE